MTFRPLTRGVYATLLVASLAWLTTAAAAAKTYNVTRTDDPDNGMGDCATTDQSCSLREALNTVNAHAAPSDVVNLPAGDYQNQVNAAFPIATSVSVVGAGSATTIINGSPISRVFALNNPTTTTVVVSIAGVTITGGNASSGSGGGILQGQNISLSLDRVALVGNTATVHGGGLGALTPDAEVTISNSLIADNSALANGQSGAGGGLYFDVPATVINSTVTGNTAGDGSGVFLGGGIVSFSSLHLLNSTVADNTATGPGAAGGNIELGGNNGSGVIGDSIISDGHVGSGAATNCSLEGAATITSAGHNIEDSNQCGFTATGDLEDTDPMLGSLTTSPDASSTLALLPGSPAINHGDPSGCKNAVGTLLTTDQRGIARPQGTACDSGAFEFRAAQLTGPPTITGTASVGQQLTCTPPTATSPDGGTVTTAFSWTRDTTAIPGATSPTYTTTAADGGHPITCTVAATNPAGTTTAQSTPLHIAAPPAPNPTGKLSATTVTINPKTGKGPLGASCTAPAGDTCTINGTLTGKHKKRIGTVNGTITAGHTGKLTIKITKSARHALGHHRLRAHLSATVTDHAGGHTQLTSTLTLKGKRHRHR